ncbi:MAG: hypothetical protein HFI86_01200 [Bacilli bacterium]|nr:hypothetical protein [Bacilli bacterium]
MKDKFLENIENEFISQIEKIIIETKKSAEEDKLNALVILMQINQNISNWIISMQEIFTVNDELLIKVAELKRPFIVAAKKDMLKIIVDMIENEKNNIPGKIKTCIYCFEHNGVDVDDNEKKGIYDILIDEQTGKRKNFKFEIQE